MAENFRLAVYFSTLETPCYCLLDPMVSVEKSVLQLIIVTLKTMGLFFLIKIFGVTLVNKFK